MYKIIYDHTRMYGCRELVSNRKIMHTLSAIVNDCIYGNDEKRGLVTVDESA